MDIWPNNAVEFRQQFDALTAEYEALKARPAWALSAADDDRLRVLFQKLALMEHNPWITNRTAAIDSLMRSAQRHAIPLPEIRR